MLDRAAVGWDGGPRGGMDSSEWAENGPYGDMPRGARQQAAASTANSRGPSRTQLCEGKLPTCCAVHLYGDHHVTTNSCLSLGTPYASSAILAAIAICCGRGRGKKKTLTALAARPLAARRGRVHQSVGGMHVAAVRLVVPWRALVVPVPSVRSSVHSSHLISHRPWWNPRASVHERPQAAPHNNQHVVHCLVALRTCTRMQSDYVASSNGTGLAIASYCCSRSSGNG